MDERVDSWGESQKAARKNLPKKRAKTHRAFRRAVKAQLQRGEDADPSRVRRKPFMKWVGPKRSVQIAAQTARRDALESNPRKSESARTRRGMRRRKRSSDAEDAN